MRKLFPLSPLLLLPFLLVGCGGSDPSTNSSDTGDEEIFVQGDTRLVEIPPTYESVPLPEGLEWITNEEDAPFSSTAATRGGTFTTYLTSFPLTLRMYGPDASTGAYVSMKRATFLSLIDIHPNTLNIIPSLATHWAFGDDGKTVYFKLDPRARWSDGVPVTADDYVFSREFQLSEYTLEPYGQNYYTNVITDVSKYDDYTISVSHGAGKPGSELLLETAIGPSPRHFHKLDENWVQDYSWRVHPNTGAYQVSSIEKGRFIEYSRVENWWGDALNYNQGRFNVDKIRLEIIRDDNVAFEYFLRGELDSYVFKTLPARWYDKAQGRIFDNGYAGKIQYYTDVPREQRGLWLNMDDPFLGDKNLRLGLAHAINMDQALNTIFRGDYERMQQQYEGYYWGYTNAELKARAFNLSLADEYLNASGWTERGSDGIRVNSGQRLSLRIIYASADHTPWLVVLREEAKKAGIELALQLLDPSAWGTQVSEKNFQVVVLTFGVNLTPSFWQGYHSDNAHLPQTNNITNTDDPVIDELIEQYDAATTLEERLVLSHRLQVLIRDTAGFIPLYKIPYSRETFWRWLQLPDTYATRISGDVFDPFGMGLFWIDEDVKRETLAAREDDRKFEPINIVDTTWRVN
jgi:microcin C transport system substrate-binding protein